MSADVLKIIPRDPLFIPAEATHAAAVAELERLLPEGEMCEAEVYEQLTFIDCGENLEAVLCPACGARNVLDHAQEDDPVLDWWYELDEQIETLSSMQTLTPEPMPCCGAHVAVTDLRFDWPAAFAHFELCIWDPQIGENLSEEQLAGLERILGCPLTQVRAHY